MLKHPWRPRVGVGIRAKPSEPGKGAGCWSALVYPCNLLGYLRICLIGAAVGLWLPAEALTLELKLTVLGLLLASSLLDALDGVLARLLDQQTRFGQCLDQVTDLMCATVLWLASGLWLAVPILILEWAGGAVALSKSTDPARQKRLIGTAFMRSYLANRQRNVLSVTANVSHVVFPAALFLGPGFESAVWLAAPGLIVFEAATLLIVVCAFQPTHPLRLRVG